MKIDIDGVGIVEVDDSFSSLSETDQQKIISNIVDSVQTQTQISPIQKTPAESQGLRSTAQGLTLGFADELEAALRNPLSALGSALGLSDGKDYNERLEIVRKKLESYRSENPLEALAYEVGGAVLPALGAGLFTAGTGTAAVGTSTAARLAPTLARAAKIGVTEGAVAGFGAGEGGFKERAKSSAIGGTFGGLLGGITPVATQQIGRGLRTGLDALNIGGQKRATTFSERKILEALERDQISLDEAKTALDEARQVGAQDIMLADLGTNLRGSGWRAQATPNKMRKEVQDALEERRSDQAINIANVGRTGLNVDNLTGLDYLDDLATRTQREAQPAYDAAYAIDLDTSPFKELAKKPVIQQAYQEALDLASIDPDVSIKGMPKSLGKFLSTTDDDVSNIFMPTQLAHQVKIGLDSLIEKQIDITGKVSQKGRNLIKLKNAWNSKIVEQNSLYAKANKDFADKAALQKSYSIGFDFFKTPEKKLVKSVNSMSKSEKEAFRTGLVSKMEETASSTNDATDFVKTIFGSPRKRSAIRLAFDNRTDFENFEKFMKLEASKMQTYRKTLGGSETAERQIQMSDAEIDPSSVISTVGQAATGNFGSAASSIANQVTSRMQGINERSAESMSRMLFNTDPAEQRRILQALNQRRLIDEESRRKMLARPEFYSGVIGTTAGLLSGESQ